MTTGQLTAEKQIASRTLAAPPEEATVEPGVVAAMTDASVASEDSCDVMRSRCLTAEGGFFP